MFSYLYEEYKQNRAFQLIVIFFGLLTVWWAIIYFRGLEEGLENNYFTLIYPILSLLGGAAGLFFTQRWGSLKSALGRAIGMLSLGLLAQFIGQAFYSYYIYILDIEIPYPSWGDLFFFGSVVLYIIGVFQLAKVSGIKLSLNTWMGKFLALVIPAAILVVSYAIFLNGYDPDWSDTILTFLDFGYPIGQAIYVSIAILTLFISKEILGGLMRKPIMLLIAALIIQYLADFSFSYQVSRETWYVGGTNDYLFALSYFLMTIALFSIGNMFYKVQKS